MFPDAGLYDRYFDIDKAADEHRNYISMLEEQGCTVHTVTNTRLSMPHRHIMSVVGQSKALEDEYQRYGVKVVWVPLENLIGGYGAAH